MFSDYSSSRLFQPLAMEIQQIKRPTTEKVRKLYGQLGVDIFQKKEQISILDKKEQTPFRKFINRIKADLGFRYPMDYSKKDSICDVILKYMCNKKCGTTKEFEEMFGEKGLEQLRRYQSVGYVEL